MIASGTPRERRRCVRLVAVLTVAGALVAGSVGCTPIAERPEAAVRAYLDRIVAGDIEGALELDGTRLAVSEVLLTNAAYRAATDRITGYRIMTTTIDGDEAQVRVRTVQKSGRALTRLTVKRTAGRWNLLPASLGYIEIRPGPDGLGRTISGQRIPDERELTLHAFPGTYRLEGVSTGDITVKSAPAALTGFGSHSGLVPAVALTARGKERAVGAAKAHLDACAALGDAARGAECPFEMDTSEKWWTTSRWNIEREPTFTVSEWEPECDPPGRSSFRSAGCWMVDSDSVPVTFTASSPASFDSTTEPVDAQLHGWLRGFTDAGAGFHAFPTRFR